MAPMTKDEAEAFNLRSMEDFQRQMGHHRHLARSPQARPFVDFYGFGEIPVVSWGADSTFWVHTHHAAELTGLDEAYIVREADVVRGGWDERLARVIPWTVQDAESGEYKTGETVLINEVGLHVLMNDERCPWRFEFLSVILGQGSAWAA